MLNGPKHLWNRDDTIVYATSHVPCGWGLGQYFSCHINLGLVLFFWRIFCCGLETKSRPQISLQWNKNASIFNWYFWQKAGSHAVWRRPQESQCFFTIKSHNFLGPPPPLPFPFCLSTLLQWPKLNFQPSHWLPLWPWSITCHPLFPCQQNGDAASQWEVQEDKCHAGTWGSWLLRHGGGTHKHLIAPYPLTSILPLSWHVASSSRSLVSPEPQGPSLAWNFSSPLPCAFLRPPKRLPTRPVALSGGKGGNNSLAHIH